MSDFSDYKADMSATTLGDREIEQLLTRATDVPDDLADLEGFLAALSSDLEPPREVSHMATSLAAVARASGRTRRFGFRRVATIAASMAILLAFSGIAMAADGAAPGDPLYGLDRALEKIGIGAGGAEERIAEFESLLAEGEDEDAFLFIGSYLDSADDTEMGMALEHLEMAATQRSPSADAALAKVEMLHEFFADNRGKEVGLDGQDFGKRVAEIARSDDSVIEPEGSNAPTTEEGDPPGKSEDAGPPSDQSGSSNAQPDKGPPDDVGPPDDAGPPATPGTTPGESASGVSGNSGGSQQGKPEDPGTQSGKETGKPDQAGAGG